MAMHSERAQGAIEYLLVIGAVAVAVMLVFMGFDTVVREFVGHACHSIDTAVTPTATAGSCIATATPIAP